MAGGANQNGSPGGEMLSQINVTPFVDVVLVLLVIFMVTAPIIAKDILRLNLPKSAATDGKALSQLGIAVNRDGQILLNGELTSEEMLRARVLKLLESDREAQAIIAADTETAYGNVVKVIDIVKSAGLSRFAIQIERR